MSVKMIQLFLKDQDMAEISNELVSVEHKDGWTTVIFKECDDIYENHFPDCNIASVRVWEENDDE